MNSKTRLRLSPHFTVEEFDCRNGKRVPALAVPALRSLCAHWLEPLREEFGPVRVTSGYRTYEYNRSIGGASASYHVYTTYLRSGAPQLGGGALAADVVPARGTVRDWVRWAETWRGGHGPLKSRRLGGVGSYQASGFIHLDTGPRRSWTG